MKENENIIAVITSGLTSDWENFAKIVSFHQNGIEQLEQWLLRKRWRESLAVSEEEAAVFAPFVVMLSFQEIRKKTIATRFFSLRKAKLEAALQRIINDFPPAPFDIIRKDRNLAPLFRQLSEAMKKEFHFIFPQQEETADEAERENDQEWLSKWAVRPHFPVYLRYYENIENKQLKSNFQKLAADMLKKQSHHPHVRRVYYRLLDYHRNYEEGIEALFHSIDDPLSLTPEEKQFIKKARDNGSYDIRVLIHHFIERFIERKTKRHYSEAINYIQLLQQDYAKDDEGYFAAYLAALQQKYSRLASFQKELITRVQSPSNDSQSARSKRK
ncbi:hypothetical protein SAMN05421736_105112 [Evansella caseinilytica]|uniref:Uncharacterized protein n=1 Tax=Evansella caseinilytica TaxID=1503961 RepID=A0A1H3PMQ3_9BACI|nr:hypothetical protein [Evansella caseinilytica]SDZ02155.1 hypothetical protein SAMN05421736_105112 [Evansella caseinilytica]